SRQRDRACADRHAADADAARGGTAAARRAHSDGPLRRGRRGRSRRALPGVRRRRLHHRPHAGRGRRLSGGRPMVAIDGVVGEDGPGGLPFLKIETDRCRARLTWYGAQLCEWTPAGQSAVLFMSPRAVFATGTAIRGGVPICFPWFGPHPNDATKPAHGFARTHAWQVAGVTRDPTGDVRVVLRLAADAETRALWSASFAVSLTLSLGAALEVRAEVEKAGDEPIVYELALHSYLAVGDVEAVRIRGLERARFVDKVDGGKEKSAGSEPLAIAGETDRVFLDTTTTCVVDD